MKGKLNQLAGRCARAASLACGFVRREPSDALLLVRMAGWVAALSLLVRVMPLPRILRLMQPRAKARGRRTPEADAAAQARLAHLLDLLLATDLLCFTPTCWKRAPVLRRYLALAGIETRVVFGVRKEGGGALAGHAWLEAHGRPLLEANAPDYKVTYSFPA